LTIAVKQPKDVQQKIKTILLPSVTNKLKLSSWKHQATEKGYYSQMQFSHSYTFCAKGNCPNVS